jgi:hypothetical protein
MLSNDDLKKTMYGLLPNFAAVFKDAHYVKMLHSNREHGTAYDYAPGEIYLGTEFRDWHDLALLPNSVPRGMVLACTPVLEMPRFSPRIASHSSYGHSVGPSCIKVISWRQHDVFLVTAGDSNMIRDVWLGFVPITERIEVK